MKNLKIILYLILVIIIPIKANADVGAPSVTPYDARVKNIDGASAKCYIKDKNETVIIPYDTILKEIWYEYNENNIVYAEVEYNDYNCIIKLKDIESIDKKVDLKEWEKREKQTLYVFKEGAYLYNGPSKVYGKVENEIMIPVGETITTEYYDDAFAYVTYKGVSGWIYIFPDDESHQIYNEESAIVYIDHGEFYTIKEEELCNDNNTTCINIPAETKLEYKYYFPGYVWSTKYYITYNGVSGWLQLDYDEYSFEVENITALTIEKTNLYKTPNEENKEIITEIPKYTELTIIRVLNQIHAPSIYYVEYNNKIGWVYESEYLIKEDNNDEVYYLEISTNMFNDKNNYDKYLLKDECYLRDGLYGNVTEDKVSIGVYEVKYSIYENKGAWLYITSDNINSWIYASELDYDEITELDYEIENEEQIKEEDNNSPKISYREIIGYCVFGAIIASLTAFVTIKLFNKTKNNKNDNLDKNDENINKDKNE